ETGEELGAVFDGNEEKAIQHIDIMEPCVQRWVNMMKPLLDKFAHHYIEIAAWTKAVVVCCRNVLRTL
ncbi:hypothetical protein Ancab_039319, partial [Ancistrocladus abbreviatus]